MGNYCENNHNKNEILIERLAKFIELQGVSVRSFEKSISASDGMIRRAIANKTDIQAKWLTAIADKYPHINIEWLVTGKGSSMVKNAANIEKVSDNYKDKYVASLEKENERLSTMIERQQSIIDEKQAIIDGFVSGDINSTKKRAG